MFKQSEVFKFCLVAAAIICSEPVARGTSAFVYSASNQFGVVDLSTGSYSGIGAPDALLSGIAAMPGQPMYAIDGSFDLRRVDPATAQTTLIGSTGAMLYGLEETSSGALYGQTGSSFYSINPLTGAASWIGDFGVTLNFDLAIGAFDSAGNLFEFGTNSGADSTVFFSVNPVTGVGTLIGPDQVLLESMVFSGKTLYGFTGLPNGGPAGPVVTIDQNTGLVTASALQDPSLDVVLGAAIQASSVPEPRVGVLIGLGIIGLYFLLRIRNDKESLASLTVE